MPLVILFTLVQNVCFNFFALLVNLFHVCASPGNYENDLSFFVNLVSLFISAFFFKYIDWSPPLTLSFSPAPNQKFALFTIYSRSGNFVILVFKNRFWCFLKSNLEMLTSAPLLGGMGGSIPLFINCNEESLFGLFSRFRVMVACSLVWLKKMANHRCWTLLIDRRLFCPPRNRTDNSTVLLSSPSPFFDDAICAFGLTRPTMTQLRQRFTKPTYKICSKPTFSGSRLCTTFREEWGLNNPSFRNVKSFNSNYFFFFPSKSPPWWMLIER